MAHQTQFFETYLRQSCTSKEHARQWQRLQWTQDLDIETLDARGHWATMEELLEVVTFHLLRYENTVKTCKKLKCSSSQSLRLNNCHEICRGVFVHQGKGVSPYDLSVLDSRHG